ncbi:MAG: immunoglobulin domain-containing protein, partial [Opitutae bacterium]
TLNLDAISEEDEGKYRCMVTNGPSTYYSKDADLVMYIPPTIKKQPVNLNQKEGGKVSLKGSATGTPDPSYQWQKLAADGSTWEDVPKANKDTLAFSKLKKENAGSYRLKASNPGGFINSDAVQLTVYYAPIITTNITSQIVNEGDSFVFTLEDDALDSNGTVSTYRWYKDKKALKDEGAVSGNGTKSLTISAADGTHAGSYWCDVKNAVGTTRSKAAKLSVLLKPYASKPLKSLDLAEGKSATFSASVKGGKPMTFQWYKNDSVMSGKTMNKLSLSGITPSDAGIYKLVASNPAGSLEMEATLAVTAASTYVVPVANDLAEDSPDRILSQALGANPTNGQTYQPIIDTVNDGSGNTYISFSYTENKDAKGIRYIPESSTDLKTWTPIDLTQAQVNRLDRGNLTEVTVYIPTTTNTAGNQFLRLVVDNGEN